MDVTSFESVNKSWYLIDQIILEVIEKNTKPPKKKFIHFTLEILNLL